MGLTLSQCLLSEGVYCMCMRTVVYVDVYVTVNVGTDVYDMNVRLSVRTMS
jgi:hypothetical protein